MNEKKGSQADDRMMTEGKVLEMFQIILDLTERSKGSCECTVQKRTGNIIDVCDACSADSALHDIYECVKSMEEA